MGSLGFLRTWGPQASQTSHRGLKTARACILTNKLGATWPSMIQPQKGCVCVLVTQLCPTLRNPMDCSPLGSSGGGILQARILEWVAISFSR